MRRSFGRDILRTPLLGEDPSFARSSRGWGGWEGDVRVNISGMPIIENVEERGIF